MTRLCVPLDGLWGMKIDVPYSLLVQDGPLAWSIGQCPLDASGSVLSPGDLQRQTDHVIGYIDSALASAQLPWSAVTKFVVYHASSDIAPTVERLAARTNGQAVIVPVAIPAFYYAGMLIEVDVYLDLNREPDKRVVSSNQYTIEIVTGSQFAVSKLAIHDPSYRLDALVKLSGVLQKAGFADTGLFVEQWYAADLELARIAGQHGQQPASPVVVSSAATPLLAEFTHAKLNVRGVQASAGGCSVIFRQTSRNYWLRAVYDGPVVNHVEQTKACMRLIEDVLRSRGLGFDSVCKSTTCYSGQPTAEELHANMTVRNARYRRPGPASTGIPVASLAGPTSRVSVSLYGASDRLSQ